MQHTDLSIYRYSFVSPGLLVALLFFSLFFNAFRQFRYIFHWTRCAARVSIVELLCQRVERLF